jgi:hypothetical protein
MSIVQEYTLNQIPDRTAGLLLTYGSWAVNKKMAKIKSREMIMTERENMYKFDVVALGELLIDFTNNGISNQGNTLFEANPGGAPCISMERYDMVGGYIILCQKDRKP